MYREKKTRKQIPQIKFYHYLIKKIPQPLKKKSQNNTEREFIKRVLLNEFHISLLLRSRSI